MSQVGIPRPASMGQKMGVSLPQIEHPLSRMGNPTNMDIRGVSRSGDRPLSHPAGRPLANENVYSGRKSVSAYGRDSRLGSRQMMQAPLPIDSIPEGVEVTYGDPAKTRLPVFGSRADVGSRMDNGAPPSRMSSRLSQVSTQARLEIDEIETMLKQRIKGSYYEIKKKFKDNDPEQKGNVSREAFYRILMTILNRNVSQNVFNRLMDRLGFKDKQIINYSEFFAYFHEAQAQNDYPRWMDPVQRMWPDKAIMTSSQVHAQLKEKVRQKFLDIADLIPQMNPGGTGRILKPEFKQMLNKLMFYMEDTEFEKLWKKYDPNNSGTVNGAQFLNALGIQMENGGEERQASPQLITGPSSNRTPRKKEIERKQSLDIERWLKNKFREGCHQMQEAFEAKDPTNSGVVSFDVFLEVLAQYHLKLEKKLLAAFLSRCAVQARRDGVPYRDFLHRFQDRSEVGMTHNILTNTKHRVNDRPASPSQVSTMSGIEVQVMNMFQRDFLALLGTFKSIDKLGLNVISQEEFRAAIESRFNFHLQDDQFDAFVDRLPLDEDGNIKYADFMQQFDTKGKAKSLFEKQPGVDLSGPPKVPSPILEVSPPEADEGVDRLVVDEPVFADYAQVRRSPQELFKVIKDLMNRRFQDIERVFYELDEINSERLSQEMMFQLLKRFDIRPEVSRGEIRDLWKTFITNTDKTLDYNEFVRHFGFSKKSASFPNAKMNPPKRGDADFMIRSRKLNCAADMLEDSLRSKVDYMWEDLRKEFVEMDPYGTGFISREEFKDVLTELCVHLSEFEINKLSDKFDLKRDGRVSYIEFLKPFALRKQIWRHGNNMLSLLAHPQPELPIHDIVEPPQKGLHGITSKLRQKLAGDWKNLRRAFRKLDTRNEGYLSVPEFRSVLKLANVILDEDEVYHVLTQFDHNMSGKIPYEKFIEETFKPPTRQSVRKI
ncbi:EF-hand calcium-binding domain-containing protein 6-like isoform X2 [Crassostrea angulata]|uniref:EF-hand domain-containing protein n=2 Tax=Magallana gigas TaxID=29159 RepID=A0A8W8MBZ1_MAGGI|nr:EF-hand calcium-binding domain-containing protein 6 isoform X7 [Crassostrea gigas]XP_052685325.1 EF-hand calcium-binding domain-containing protein 6-like isoform X2 [Crassostrea angulata]